MTQGQLLRSETQAPYLPPPVRVISGLQGSYSLGNMTVQNPYGFRVPHRVQFRHTVQGSLGRRHIELKWRQANRKALLQYVGQWVVLERDQIKATASSLGEAV